MAAGSVGPAPQLIDYQSWSNINATPFDFAVNNGVFALSLHATVWGNAQLNQLLADGSTYVPVGGAIASDGMTEFHLSAGQYQLTLTGVTGLTGVIEKIGQWAGR